MRLLVAITLAVLCWRSFHATLAPRESPFVYITAPADGTTQPVVDLDYCPRWMPGNRRYDESIDWKVLCWDNERQAFVQYSIMEQ